MARINFCDIIQALKIKTKKTMKNQKVGTGLGTIVLVIIAITIGTFAWVVIKNRDVASEVQEPVNIKKPITTQSPYQNENTQYGNNQSDEKDLSNSKITTKYINNTYGFEFEYPQNLVITQNATDSVFGLSDKPDGHWVINVTVAENTSNLSLKQAFDKEMNRYIKRGRNIMTSDISVGGKSAKKFSIKNYGDNGNVVVVIINGKNIITIYGTDSSTFLNTIFETTLNSFVFIK